MRPIIIFLALAGVGIITWLVVARPGKTEQAPKAQALPVSKHTDAFNANMTGVLEYYQKLNEDFVNWDSAGAATTAAGFIKRLEVFAFEELIDKSDSSLYLTAKSFVENMAVDLGVIMNDTTIRMQREAFHNITDNFRQLLNTVKYDREILYLQECPMAFDDTKSAQWISKSGEDKDRRNPYLGLKDPKYGKGMLKCGETIQTINHTGKEVPKENSTDEK